MTRQDIIDLHDTWQGRGYDLQAELNGRIRGAHKPKGMAKARMQTQAQLLITCAADLQALLDKPVGNIGQC